MLNQLKLFFDRHIALAAPDLLSDENIHLACATLFIEMMAMDGEIKTEEQEMILKRVTNMFSLSELEATELIALATTQRNQATDYYEFTSLINKSFTQEQKISLIKTLWQIAYADGQLNEYEEYMVRKIADLLYVPHADFIKAKVQVNNG